MTIDRNAKINVPCPQCGKDVQQPFGRLKGKVDVTCPECRTSFTIDASQLQKGLAERECSIERMLKGLGKRLQFAGRSASR
ncbi:YnfU family zinc-binding protein [Achromobacter piechaudii]|uniref:Zinc finger/thioredoxin putative domain-containing protein n=1 Tax=Achromobacter piechaudii TaxID=72556 RepID=A0A6S7ENY4_9BURK|nr:YnfU family zinc-binding protein [Achromobacter piechaudii]CAB3916037.1 hypothetical protein LMG1861_05087 [Achromobacter piechaudii]